MKQLQYIIVWGTVVFCFLIQSIYGFLESSNNDRISMMTTNQAMFNGNDDLHRRRISTYETRDFRKIDSDQRNFRHFITTHEPRMKFDDRESSKDYRRNTRSISDTVESIRDTRQDKSAFFRHNRKFEDRQRSNDFTRLNNARNNYPSEDLRDNRQFTRHYRELRDNRVQNLNGRERYISRRESQDHVFIPSRKRNLDYSTYNREFTRQYREIRGKIVNNVNTRERTIPRRENQDQLLISSRQRNTDYPLESSRRLSIIPDFKQQTRSNDRYDFRLSRNNVPVGTSRRRSVSRYSRNTIFLDDTHNSEEQRRSNSAIYRSNPERESPLENSRHSEEHRRFNAALHLNISRRTKPSERLRRRVVLNIRFNIPRDRRLSEPILYLESSRRKSRMGNLVFRNTRENRENTNIREASDRRMIKSDERNRYAMQRKDSNRSNIRTINRNEPGTVLPIEELGKRQYRSSIRYVSSRINTRQTRGSFAENSSRRNLNIIGVRNVQLSSLENTEFSTERGLHSGKVFSGNNSIRESNIRSKELDRRSTINTRNIRVEVQHLANGWRSRYISSSGRIKPQLASFEGTKDSRYNIHQEDSVSETENKNSSFQSYDLVLFAIFAMQMISSSSLTKGLRPWGLTTVPKEKIF